MLLSFSEVEQRSAAAELTRYSLTARGAVHGSLTAYRLRHARCPVVVAPPDGRARTVPFAAA